MYANLCTPMSFFIGRHKLLQLKMLILTLTLLTGGLTARQTGGAAEAVANTEFVSHVLSDGAPSATPLISTPMYTDQSTLKQSPNFVPTAWPQSSVQSASRGASRGSAAASVSASRGDDVKTRIRSRRRAQITQRSLQSPVSTHYASLKAPVSPVFIFDSASELAKWTYPSIDTFRARPALDKVTALNKELQSTIAAGSLVSTLASGSLVSTLASPSVSPDFVQLDIQSGAEAEHDDDVAVAIHVDNGINCDYIDEVIVSTENSDGVKTGGRNRNRYFSRAALNNSDIDGQNNNDIGRDSDSNDEYVDYNIDSQTYLSRRLNSRENIRQYTGNPNCDESYDAMDDSSGSGSGRLNTCANCFV